MNNCRRTLCDLFDEKKSKLYQYGIVVWFEPHSNNIEAETFFNCIEDKVEQVEVFDDVDICINFILSSQHSKVFFIISGMVAKTLVPLIHDIQAIDSICIYCKNCPIYRIDNQGKYNKIIGIFDDQNFLVSILFERLQKYQTSNDELLKNAWQKTPQSLLTVIVQDWLYKNSQTPATITQNVLLLYDSKSNRAFYFEIIKRKLLMLPNIHLEIEHNLNSAFEKMGSFPFSYWRVVVDSTFAEEFVSVQRKQMISRYICVSIIIYHPQNNCDLSWAKNNPELVWGGVQSEDEMILLFCSGDPLTRMRNMCLELLFHFDKQKALNFLNDSLKTKLPFAFVTDYSHSISERLDGSELQSRTDRFTDLLTPQFIVNFRENRLLSVMANLLTVNNRWHDDVESRRLMGILSHAVLNDRPMEHLRSRLLKWLSPVGDMVPAELTAVYCIRAFTEETFLYKDVNWALAQNDQKALRCLRDYINKCLLVFTFKSIPCYSGILYRGVQMTENDLKQYKVGIGIQFLGFMSTSKSLELVQFRGTNVIFIIHTLSSEHQEKLIRYTNVDLHKTNISVMPSEEEVLFAPFSSFDVKSIDMDKNGNITFITLQENDLSAVYHMQLCTKQQDADKGCTGDVLVITKPLEFH